MQPAVQKKAKLEELRDKLQEALAARDENAEEIRKEEARKQVAAKTAVKAMADAEKKAAAAQQAAQKAAAAAKSEADAEQQLKDVQERRGSLDASVAAAQDAARQQLQS